MKTFTIASNTFREGVRQPFYLLVTALTAGLLLLHRYLPFFTLSEDIRMFKDVCLAYMLIGLLVVALLLASKVVDEEIENKTMLTLMSKPVRRWELIVGKYLGVMGAVTLALAVLAAVLWAATWYRVADELRISPRTLDEELFAELQSARWMHSLSLLPGLALMWLQLAVMASISVAISTRVGLILNLVAGIGIFVAAHLTPFLPEGPARSAAVVLPFLEHFNLNDLLIYKNLVFGGGPVGPGQVAYAEIWRLVGLAGLYAVGYVAVALLAAMALFRTRELG